MSQVTSKDGTAIAYERVGEGPPLILVDGALCSRAFGPMPKLAPLLARSFTVYLYDRRGRGESGDRPPFAKDRELDDLAALIGAAGGAAALVGLSSGAALALEAAAARLPVTAVVAYEPPYVEPAGSRRGRAHQARLQELVAGGDRGGAVRYFMRDMVGVPAPVVWMMRLLPGLWRKLAAVGHTLPYDAAVMGDFTVPAERLGKVAVPTLVMHGAKTDARLKRASAEVAGAVPAARSRTLAGQNHNVSAAAVAPAVIEFLRAPQPQ
ncbi:MAG TPA: alpha/beta hydrolase [Polyangia bacterium]|jgi:pimeloyl-ACP methyl ester carboxylesterase